MSLHGGSSVARLCIFIREKIGIFLPDVVADGVNKRAFYLEQQKKITVTVPAGIDNGGRIAIRGMGNDGANGGPAGDLIIEVRVRRHPIFRREGAHIYCDVPITISEATLGAEIDIPTLDGNKKYKIPEGTQNGTSFTMRQEGACYVNNPNRRGDLIFTVNVEIPRGLSSKQAELMRQFAEASGESNYTKRESFLKRILDKKGRS